MLRHLNIRFNGDFDLEQFAHKAFYNPVAHQIEMHLCSLRTQTVVLQALNKVSLAAGETIRTEISRKVSSADFTFCRVPRTSTSADLD